MPRSQWGFPLRIEGRPSVVPVLTWLLWWLLTVAVQAAWAREDDLALVTQRTAIVSQLLGQLRVLEKAIAGPCLERYCQRLEGVRRKLASLEDALDEAIAQTRGMQQWTSGMAGYENEAAWEQYVRKDVARKEERSALKSAILDFADIITGDLSKIAGALSKGLRESGWDVEVGSMAGGAITGGAGDYGVMNRSSAAGSTASGRTSGGKISREAFQGVVKGAIGPLITQAFRKAGISDENILGEVSRETVNQMAGLLVDKYLQSNGEPFNPSPYAIGGMLVKAAVAAFARKKLVRLRKDLAETYRYMDERERKRRWYIEQWFHYNRLKKRLDETATKVRGMVAGIDRLPCERPEDLSSRAGSAHPVPDWRKQTPDPDPALQRAAQIVEELLASSSGIGYCRVAGRVVDESRAPVAGSRVQLVLAGKELTSATDQQGAFLFRIPKSTAVPLAVSLTARKKGYVSGSTTVIQREFEKAQITLLRQSPNIIEVDSGLHHLGDSHYKGAINSQFQHPKAESTEVKWRFQLDQSVALNPERIPFLIMEGKGIQYKNPVLLNGQEVAVLPASNASGESSRIELALNPCALRAGENELVIRSAEDSNQDRDDFEISNVQIHFKPAAAVPVAKGRVVRTLNSVRLLSSDFKTRIEQVPRNGYISIEAKGKGSCGVRPDRAELIVFAKSAGEDSGKRVTLWETGSDSGIFRTKKPLPVADFSVEAGDRLVVRAGLRAASVLVTPTRQETQAQARKEQFLKQVAEAEKDYRRLGEQWKELGDFIEEKRARGEEVEDLMENLQRLMERWQQARARLLELRRRAGLDTGSIEVHGKPWTGGDSEARP